jgi:hypothetical protein
MKIPKILHCIRIGELPAPMKWINSWKEKHQDREYILRWNKELEETKRINQKQIEYYKSQKKRAGVADIMRYEILYKIGWAMHWADSLCLENISELFIDWYENYAVDTSHKEWQPTHPNNINSVAPLYACKIWSELAKKLIEEIWEITVYNSAAKTVWNRLMQKVLNENKYNIKLRPQHYFLPEHYNWYKYQWPDKRYAKHYWGKTKWTYAQWL